MSARILPAALRLAGLMLLLLLDVKVLCWKHLWTRPWKERGQE